MKTEMTFDDEDLKRFKRFMSEPTEYPLPWATEIIDGELWSIKDADKHEVITCDAGVYGPGVEVGEYICDLVNRASAILSRLNAAERLIDKTPLMAETANEYDAWRKVAGK